VGLLAFGALNIACFFIGDILVIYAVLGSILFLFRNASQKTLIVWGCIIYAIQILLVSAIALMMYLGVTFAPEEMVAVTEEFAVADAKARIAGPTELGEVVGFHAHLHSLDILVGPHPAAKIRLQTLGFGDQLLVNGGDPKVVVEVLRQILKSLFVDGGGRPREGRSKGFVILVVFLG